MTEEHAKKIIDAVNRLERRVIGMEQLLFNKLKIAKIINVSDNKVHMVMTIVDMWETTDGVIIQVK